MKHSINTLLLICVISVLALASCASESENSTGRPDTVLTIAFKKNHWTYISLREGKVLGMVSINDSTEEKSWKARTDWDIAICNGHIRTNSGDSGSGNGGITVSQFPYDETDVSSAPEFVVDGDTVRFEKEPF